MQTMSIEIYKNDPVWDRVGPNGLRWFQLPLAELDRLFLARYEVCGDHVCEGDVRRHAQELRAVHPDCVFVHI